MINEALAAYPGWKRVPDFSGVGTRIAGPLVLVDPSGATNRAQVEVTVPREFPAEGAHPLARIVSHDFGKVLTEDAHVGGGRDMCVQMPERNEINYERVGLRGFLEQVELHVRRARIWAMTGKYPGPEYDHFDAGRREYQQELAVLRAPFEALKSGLPPSLAYLVDPTHKMLRAVEKCPCKSGLMFKACHRDEIKRRRAQWRTLGHPPQRPMKSGGMLLQLGGFLARRRKH